MHIYSQTGVKRLRFYNVPDGVESTRGRSEALPSQTLEHNIGKQIRNVEQKVNRPRDHICDKNGPNVGI